jgi:DNA polymerase III alpha subunit (gram-positive type)
LRLLALDLETTGVDRAVSRITEIGAALYDTERRQVLVTLNTFVRIPPGVEFPERVQKLTGITPADLEEFGGDLPDVLLELGTLAVEHDVRRLVGHNAKSFDREMLLAEIDRLVVRPPAIVALAGLPWIDTIEDLPLPDSTTSRRLEHLAADHGLSPNGFAHRALFDALQSLRLMGCYPLEDVVRRADSPTTIAQAVVGFSDNDKARQLGFTFNPPWKPGKHWVKRIKDCDAEELRRRASEIGLELRRVA